MTVRSLLLTLIVIPTLGTVASAGYPVLSWFTRPETGPYQPSAPRYIVVDPVPAANPTAPGHHGAVDPNAHVQWERRDAPTAAYPYGWFGARHATVRWSHTGYYGNYTDVRILHGR